MAGIRRILHGPSNVAGMAGLLARGQREIGHDSLAICRPNRRFRFPADAWVGEGRVGEVRLSHALAELSRVQILHIYFGESFLGRELIDARIAQRLGKRVFFTFLGCDIRDSKARQAGGDWSICGGCWPQGCSANRVDALRAALESRETIFVATPDLLEEVPTAVWLPLPVDLSFWRPTQPAPQNGVLRIFHAPTDEGKKGTIHLRAAINALVAKGAPVELVTASGERADLVRAASGCHVAVDQVTSGVYGTTGAEMMALGLPVIARIDARARAIYPEDLPVISADPDSLPGVLEGLISGRVDLVAAGIQAAVYAARVHGHIGVAKSLEAHY